MYLNFHLCELVSRSILVINRFLVLIFCLYVTLAKVLSFVELIAIIPFAGVFVQEALPSKSGVQTVTE